MAGNPQNNDLLVDIGDPRNDHGNTNRAPPVASYENNDHSANRISISQDSFIGGPPAQSGAHNPYGGANEHQPQFTQHSFYSQSSGLNHLDQYYDDGDDARSTQDAYYSNDGYAGVNKRASTYSVSNIMQRAKSLVGGKNREYSEMDLPLTEQRRDTITGVEDTSSSGGPPPKKRSNESGFKFGFGRNKVDPATLGPRIIHLNKPLDNAANKYVDNHISTAKYNVATFIPKFLYEQFSKYANLFFLFTAGLQQIPDISPTNRYTTIGPLIVVLLVSAGKELIEDFKRKSSDTELNRSKAQVLTGSEFLVKKWIDVRVGDIVRVESEDPFPADLILLASSEPEGLCYIETANLDGETNLKIKQALPETSGLVDPGGLSRISGRVRSEQPNSSLYTYEGTLMMSSTGGEREIPLNPDQLLLRGATLRNTPWIHGIVVFTGHETKLMRNATATPIKRTAVERMVNVQIVMLVGILMALSLISSAGDVIKQSTSSTMSYLHLQGNNKVKQFFSDILTYWVLYSNLVPISLFVTVEIVKYYQAFLINSDIDIYHAETDTPAVCRTSSLVEELGQIEYIFSDKTGTLTCNMMEFKQCSIGGLCYAEEVPEDRRATVQDGQTVGIHDFKTLAANLKNHESRETIHHFLAMLATCHTVIPERKSDDPNDIKYQAASPDEGALVEGAVKLGYRFVARRPKVVTIEVAGQQYDYELLNVCEFNSTRKRMSTIFRCPDGKIRIFTKGADTVIIERLAPNDRYLDATGQHLEDYATEGLRTLCLAMREIPNDEYREWSAIFEKAATTINNRGEELDKAAELIETNLQLLGATAIEDRLQDGVPETIHTLQTAGIKIWVLTGDRQETAINIGMSCKLISEEMAIVIINEETAEATATTIQKKLDAYRSQKQSGEQESLALVIDGKSLSFALEKPLDKKFLDLAVMCKAVICCRVSPLQKALVVKLVKRNLPSLLLAIGDGANDVSMIQAAHVGVGISGMEGLQAARSADVSIAQFRFLRKLLLVHGSWSYQRISKVILYSFYKNITLYMTQFWYSFQNAFSGQVIYESWTLSFYNVFFTVLPPLVMGIFDQFISARLLDRYPQLYQLGQKGEFFKPSSFWAWLINGFYHSLILYIVSQFIFLNDLPQEDGKPAGHWLWGTALYTAVLATVLGKAALVTNMWTKYTLMAIPGSMMIWMILMPIYASVAPGLGFSTEYFGIVPRLLTSPVFWGMAVVLPALCLTRDFAWKYAKRMYYPQTYHHIQEIQKYNIQDYRPRMEQFQKAIRKVRQVQRMRKQRGYAFSQGDEGAGTRLINAYDTTQARGEFGERRTAASDPQHLHPGYSAHGYVGQQGQSAYAQ
ncbi:hypothetical protein BZA77DRAFT_336364 [Pyronema omphalodes]|nr:hypothetical protein BZA77DRAFT_336364 [Pyronema omphalodes]